MLTVQPAAPPYPYLAAFFELIGAARTQRLRHAAARIRDHLAGGTLWHVNSTGAGGGVAEMLHTVLSLYRSLGVPAGWMVIGGDIPFFAVAKGLGTALYGIKSDGHQLDAAARKTYTDGLSANADEIRRIVTPADVLILHDHQTAGLTGLLSGDVQAAYWRCHVGVDEPTEASQAAWRFLRPLLAAAAGTVFSVPGHVPDFLRGRQAAVIPPFLSPHSAKNCELSEDVVRACLVRCGLRDGSAGPLRVPTPAGPVSVRNPVRVIADRPPQGGEPLLVQVSRWDRLKDMHGVLAAFASGVDRGYLALVGPDPAGVPDDIEQAEWFERCLAARRALAGPDRQRTSLICLPMADLAENAILVNAIQRAADVVIQKSLAEGFGLTVTEAMWKARVVLASAVGGIAAQISHGDTGLLVPDPADLPAFGALLAAAMDGPADRLAMGERARRRVQHDFLPDHEIVATADLLCGSPGQGAG
jgi:trehalose synthase